MNVPATQHEQLVKTARVWVAQTFFGEMLKQMRNSPFHSEMFDGGRGGQAFSAQLDQHLAERMTQGHAGDRLVQSIVRKIEHKGANSPEKLPKTNASAAAAASAYAGLIR